MWWPGLKSRLPGSPRGRFRVRGQPGRYRQTISKEKGLGMLLNGRALAWHVRGSVFNPHDWGEKLRQVEVTACALSLLLSFSFPLSVLPQLWGPEGGAGVGRAEQGLHAAEAVAAPGLVPLVLPGGAPPRGSPVSCWMLTTAGWLCLVSCLPSPSCFCL